jgi:hypothetical protein
MCLQKDSTVRASGTHKLAVLLSQHTQTSSHDVVINHITIYSIHPSFLFINNPFHSSHTTYNDDDDDDTANDLLDAELLQSHAARNCDSVRYYVALRLIDRIEL